MKYLLMVSCLVLVACSSQPSYNNQQYLLATSNQAVLANPSAPLLVVDVELAPYLDVDGLVYQVSQSEIVEAQQNQWAMDLRHQVQNQLVTLLKQKQTQYWPAQLNDALKTRGSDHLVVNFTQFNGSYTGSAIVAGEWMVISGEGVIKQTHTFSETVALKDDGYAALVSALNKALQTVSNHIAHAL